jgi:transposase-like protein
MPVGGSKYTPARVKRIVAARRSGTSLKAAAAAGGISFETLDNWRARYPEFKLALDTADAEHQREMLEALRPQLLGDRDPETGELLRDAAGKPLGLPSPDVLMRYLGHKWPEEFGRRRVELTGADGGAVEVTDPEANRRNLAARLDRLARRRAEIAGGNGQGGPPPREPEKENGEASRAGV